MEKFIKEVKIQNFKSVKDAAFGAKRVNVFIGKPNSGKSNLLEALSILGHEYSDRSTGYLRDIIRYEDISNLFYDDDFSKEIRVSTDLLNALVLSNNNHGFNFIISSEKEILSAVEGKKTYSSIQEGFEAVIKDYQNQGKSNILEQTHHFIIYSINKDVSNQFPFNNNRDHSSPFKKYQWAEVKESNSKFHLFLAPPNGNNLFTIVDQNADLRKEIAELFSESGLEFVLSKKEGKFEIQKSIDGYVYKYPFNGIADTFRRYIFYLAAIESNKDSILLLEEPEVHSFPPYVKAIADRVIASETNQFFISTHSPYLLHTLIEELKSDELNVNLVYYEDYQTKVKTLSEEELRDILDLSIDVFFNLERFLDK